jgi:hypothetical protein
MKSVAISKIYKLYVQFLKIISIFLNLKEITKGEHDFYTLYTP